MAAIATTMAMLNAKCMSIKSPKPTVRPISFPNLPKRFVVSKPMDTLNLQLPQSAAAAPVVAGAIFSTLSTSDAALAAQQIADIAEGGDNRGLALLLPITLAIGWVLYNIFQPALNQLDRMRSEKGFVVGVGLGGGLAAAAGGFLSSAPDADAIGEVATVADASSDGRGLLLLFVVTPAVLWVLYNILQPALNQINKMRSG